jgi:hypothetical protein
MWRNRPVDKLSKYWAAQGLPFQPGATREAVKQFETTHNVVLPAEMRDYFLKQDGMSSDWQYSKDKTGFCKWFSLWDVARVRPAAEELAEGDLQAGPELDQYFAFADFLDWSWAYAIRLTSHPREGGRVVMLGTADGLPLEIAASFGEFVDLLIQDSPRLYPAKT